LITFFINIEFILAYENIEKMEGTEISKKLDLATISQDKMESI